MSATPNSPRRWQMTASLLPENRRSPDEKEGYVMCNCDPSIGFRCAAHKELRRDRYAELAAKALFRCIKRSLEVKA